MRDDRRALWAAVAVLTLAALTREILVYFMALAALSCLVRPHGTRLRHAGPWLIGLGVFALGYGAHTVAAAPYLAPQSAALSYLAGGPSFALDALTRFADGYNGTGVALVIFFLLGIAGAAGSYRRAGRQFSAFAVAALVLPMVAMLRIGNPGIDARGMQVNYWGNLVVPFALALWPAWTLLVPAQAPSRE
jgi:hypothetical protein